jgi:hypothetical protein
MEDRGYIVYQDDENFLFCASMPEILSFKHPKIQEFAKNYHISAMKMNKCLYFIIYRKGLLH